jgi:hypothetical protein
MPETLRQKLEELHQAVHGAARVDPAARELLREILADIETLLERSERGVAGEERQGETLIERLREAVDRFEETHPTLTEAAGRVIDQLARMGI